MYSIKLGTLVLIAINFLPNKVTGLRLDDDELKKVILLMQQKLLHGQLRTQDRGRIDNDDLIDNGRTLVNFDDLNEVQRTNSEVYKENPMTIFILKAKEKPKVPQEDTVVKNLLKEIILHEKLSHKKRPANPKPNFKTDDYSDEVKDLKKYSKLYFILNTNQKRNVLNNDDLNDIGKLLSQVLSSKGNHNNDNKKRYYKGFAIKDDESFSRRRRDSDQSEAEDYRPKRSRIQNNGSVGGRTFAPSLGKKRHVYEST